MQDFSLLLFSNIEISEATNIRQVENGEIAI